MNNGKNETIEFYKDTVLALSELCISMHVLDLEAGDFSAIKTNENIVKFAEGRDTLQDKLTGIMVNMCEPDKADELKEFINLSTLPERLKDTKSITCFFCGRFHGWCKAVFIKMPGEQTLRHVLYIVFDVDKEVRRSHELEDLQNENKKLQDTVNALMDGYSSVCRINFATDKLEALRISPRVKQSLGLTGKRLSYKAVSMYYISNGVLEEDREELSKITTPEYILSNTEIGGSIKTTFRNNLGFVGELKIVRLDEDSALFGFVPFNQSAE